MPVNGVKLEIQGAKELEVALEQLPGEIAIACTKKGLKEAGNMIMQAAKARTPVGTRHKVKDKRLSESWKCTVSRRDLYIKVKVVNNAPHAHLVEEGHNVKKNGKIVGWSPAKPFLFPAFFSNKEKALELMVQATRSAVDKTWKKIQSARYKARGR